MESLKNELKRVKIHILPVKALYTDENSRKYTSAIIGLSSNPEHLRKISLHGRSTCVLLCEDVDKSDRKGSFSQKDADLIKHFIHGLSESEIKDLYIACDAGESRGPAVAASLLRVSGKSDEHDRVWRNPYYHPNHLIYQTMSEAYGIDVNEEELRERKNQNRHAFQTAIKNSSTQDYERCSVYDFECGYESSDNNIKRHKMNLYQEPYQKIYSGQKTYELRLYDDKRQHIHVKDEILFSCSDAGNTTFLVRVNSIHCFGGFAELYYTLPLEKCGYTSEAVNQASPHDMNKFYSLEQQRQYGAVAIEIEHI